MLLVDLSEPSSIVELLSKSVPVTVLNLNQTDRSDYYYGGEDGKSRQFSRKQAGELLANIDEAEKQLRDYYENADENYQIVEGIISPVPLSALSVKQHYAVKSGKLTATELQSASRLSTRNPVHIGGTNELYAYRVDTDTDRRGNPIHRLSGTAFAVSSAMLFSWLRSLDRVGITTHFTINEVDTARLLVAFYKNDQKQPEEHTVLNRYIRPRVAIHEQNSLVKALMGLSWAYGIGIGEEKAKSLATHYKTIYDLNFAEVDELCQCEGIGKVIAEKLLVALGREL